jgi:hypothetical protein
MLSPRPPSSSRASPAVSAPTPPPRTASCQSTPRSRDSLRRLQSTRQLANLKSLISICYSMRRKQSAASNPKRSEYLELLLEQAARAVVQDGPSINTEVGYTQLKNQTVFQKGFLSPSDAAPHGIAAAAAEVGLQMDVFDELDRTQPKTATLVAGAEVIAPPPSPGAAGAAGGQRRLPRVNVAGKKVDLGALIVEKFLAMDHRHRQPHELRKRLRALDEDGGGSITPARFSEFLRLLSLNVSAEHLQRYFGEWGGGDGASIRIDAFIAALMPEDYPGGLERSHHQARGYDTASLHERTHTNLETGRAFVRTVEDFEAALRARILERCQGSAAELSAQLRRFDKAGKGFADIEDVLRAAEQVPAPAYTRIPI